MALLPCNIESFNKCFVVWHDPLVLGFPSTEDAFTLSAYGASMEGCFDQHVGIECIWLTRSLKDVEIGMSGIIE